MLDNYAQEPAAEHVLIALKAVLADMYPNGWQESSGDWIGRVAARVARDMTSSMIKAAYMAGDLGSVAMASVYREGIRRAVSETLRDYPHERLLETIELAVWDRKMLARLDRLEAQGRARNWEQN